MSTHDPELLALLDSPEGAPATATTSGQRAVGRLRSSADHMRLSLDEVTGVREPGDDVLVEVEHGRTLIRLSTRMLSSDASAWILARPHTVERRDRRRFDRITAQEQCSLAIVRGNHREELQLVDVSVNGASFLVPPTRLMFEGDRVTLEVAFEDAVPTEVTFEVLGVRDNEDGKPVARGRFLAPDDEDDVWMSLNGDRLAELLQG